MIWNPLHTAPQHQQLLLTTLQISAIWIFANVGFYLSLPALGYTLSYNQNPILISLYFLAWSVVSIVLLRHIFSTRFLTYNYLWWYGLLCAGCATLVWFALWVLASLPTLTGPLFIPYSDILFAGPWYFLPKATEILLQQVLLTALILALYSYSSSLRKVIVGFAFLFTTAHIFLYAISDAPKPYAIIMVVAAFVSSTLFPYLILKTESGFIYTYAIHLFFYIVLALFFQTFPPPNYSV